ncbi:MULTISPECIES: DUF4878 domain-containing protein [unclassified Campylobacter]|uniref:DUF4878 domain-containing protein n=1 Tax=unclassified Campylobacter TaxID=2593542 RepID=UPI0022E9A29B|nr:MULTISPECIES: DUF4878 domain-containing protein [unclassified Campylobacter]MDA3055020.1 DUF4878 domain-containing protein [Campylobacter sp. VBCF_07 NA4]MDA3060522.1 DUF4878 domain-containing protein [Campylobacter sp. VBCF_02 NA5]MDA3070212.1 DUF4878 domain-containing protein [Campylobacter sp. VBCF_08 NA3]
MKKLILAFLAMFFLIGCGGGSVENTVKGFLEAGYAGDTKTAASLIYLSKEDMQDESVKPALEGKVGMLVGEAMQVAKKHNGLKSIEIVDKNLGEDVGTVKVRIVFKDGKTIDDMMKVRKNHKGEWKVDIF